MPIDSADAAFYAGASLWSRRSSAGTRYVLGCLTTAVDGDAIDADPVDPRATADGSLEPGTRREASDTEQAEAEAGASELALSVTLEGGAGDPPKFVLLDLYSQPIKTWESVAGGDVRLELPPLESDHYLLEVSASGYGARHVALAVSSQGTRANVEALQLYRRRYAKRVVEDITATRPTNLDIIDSRRR